MSMQDNIADMLTRIRNAQRARKTEVVCDASKFKQAVLSVLLAEGYIHSFVEKEQEGKRFLLIGLSYQTTGDGKDVQPVISELNRVSRPGLRRYVSFDEMPRFYDGLGILIISTSEGVMSDRQIRKKHA